VGRQRRVVDHWRPWYAHITLAMLAAVYLAATEHQREAEKGDLEPVPGG
jgi:SRSO17 transposase